MDDDISEPPRRDAVYARDSRPCRLWRLLSVDELPRMLLNAAASPSPFWFITRGRF